MKFTQVAADAFEKLQLNAGVLLTEFDPTTGVLDRTKIFGATTGGTSFTASPEFTDFGEDIDNVPNNTMELKRLSTITVTMSGTFLTVDSITAQRLIGAADVESNGKVVPRMDLLQDDFFDVWWVGDYSDINTGDSAGFIAIKLINALSTGGFQLQSGDAAKGQMSYEFTGHYSLSDITIVPYEIYIQDGSDETVDTTLTSLTFGSLTLVPEFDSDVKSYTTTTTNETNTITATETDEDAAVAITVNGDSIANGTAATWVAGENTVIITVSYGDKSTKYTVKVTKSE